MRQDPRGARRAGVRHPAVRGHALPAEGGDQGGGGRREDPDQPGQLCRRPQELRGDRLRDRRGLLQGPRLLRRGVHAARPGVQEAQPRDADRHQPRLALGAHALLLRRHAARDGRVGDRVRRHLPRQRLPQLRLLDEGVEPVGDGAGVPPPRRRAVPPRLGLPAPPRRHRGGRGRGRTDEDRDRDRRAPRRRPGRHDPRLAHRGPRARARAVQSARRDRRRARTEDGEQGVASRRRSPRRGPRDVFSFSRRAPRADEKRFPGLDYRGLLRRGSVLSAVRLAYPAPARSPPTTIHPLHPPPRDVAPPPLDPVVPSPLFR